MKLKVKTVKEHRPTALPAGIVVKTMESYDGEREQNGDIPSQGLKLENPEHNENTLVKGLDLMRRNREFCDVVLSVGAHRIYGHRAVLACASPSLFELFNEGEENSSHENITHCQLDEKLDKASVELLVEYAYTGKLNMEPDQVYEVFLASSSLKVDYVQDSCKKLLLENLRAESVCMLRSHLASSSDLEFAAKVDTFIHANFKEVVETADFGSLPLVQVEMLHMCQEEASTVNSNQMGVLILDWLKTESLNEDISMTMMRDKVHMLYLNTNNCLRDCNEIENGEVSDSEMLQDYKTMSKRHAYPNSKLRLKKTSSKPRHLLFWKVSEESLNKSEDKDWNLIAILQAREDSYLMMATLGGTLFNVSIVSRVNPPSPTSSSPLTSRPPSMEHLDSICAIQKMENARCALGAGTLNGKLIVCGGYDRGECLKSVEEYDPELNTWTDLPALPDARGRLDIAVVEEGVVAVGGCSGSEDLSSVEMYDIKSQTWSKISSFPYPRSSIGVCHDGDLIYVIGGWINQRGTKYCDTFNWRENQWEKLPNMHTGRYQAAVEMYEGEIFACGGCDGWNCLLTCEVYSTKTNTWQFTSNLSTPRRGAGICVFKGKLWVIGGTDGSQSLCTTEYYDGVTNTWNMGPSLTTPRSNVSATVVNDKMYIIGGFSGKSFLNTIEVLSTEGEEFSTYLINSRGPHILNGILEDEVQENGHSPVCENGDTRVNGHSEMNGHEVKVNGHSNGYVTQQPTSKGGEVTANGHSDGVTL